MKYIEALESYFYSTKSSVGPLSKNLRKIFMNGDCAITYDGINIEFQSYTSSCTNSCILPYFEKKIHLLKIHN